MIPKTEFVFILRIIGDATSDFVLEWPFKLNCFETTGHINSKLRTIYNYTKMRVIGRLVML